MIKSLKKEGIKIVMLTGDNQKVASKIAEEAGVDEYYSNLYPQDKASLIDKFHKDGYSSNDR